MGRAGHGLVTGRGELCSPALYGRVQKKWKKWMREHEGEE